jgi:hypothetical protein
MRRVVLPVLLGGLLVTAPLAAQESAVPQPPVAQAQPAPAAEPDGPPEGAPWQPVWGLAGLRVIDGPRIAPNGQEFHPSFSLDLNVNLWLWRSQGIYLFNDLRFWGERAENSVTNRRDGPLGFSKREFDLTIGSAWNYAGFWEARISGYSFSNLNRGWSPIIPSGILDGAVFENRYYLSDEYARLGQPGFDVARATFLGAGVFPTKDLVGNNGKTFHPLGMLRAYLTYDLLDWPVYAFGDATLITDRRLAPRLLLFDVGLAARPFSSWRQWEFRAGAENTADFQARNVLNLWYVSLRYIF